MKILSLITMNHSKYTFDIIRKSWNYFDRFVIVDGNIDEDTIDEYRMDLVEQLLYYDGEKIPADVFELRQDDVFENDEYHIGDKLVVINSPWQDDFTGQYSKAINHSQEGDWILHLDDDEFPSQLLLDNLDKIIEESDNGRNFDIVMLPVVDHLDEERLWNDDEVPQQYIQGMWTKHILIRRGKDPIKLWKAGDEKKNCHAVPQGTRYRYYQYPYYHFRNTDDYLTNELWEMFLTPEHQRLTPIEVARFEQGCKLAKINSSREFMQRIKEGTIGPLLEKLAIESREKFVGPNNDIHPLNQLFVKYFLIYGHKQNMIPSDSKDLEWYRIYISNWKRKFKTYKDFV